MATLSSKLDLLSISCYGGLSLTNRRRWLEGHMDNNIFSITDSALDTPRSVGFGSGSPCFGVNVKFVVVILSGQQSSFESISRFKTLGGRNRHACFRKVRLEFIENGRSEASGNISGDTSNDTTDGISSLSDLVNASQHFCGITFIRASNHVRVNIFHGECVVVNIFRLDVLNLRNVGQDFNVVVHFQDFSCHGSGSYSANGLSGRRSASTRDSTNTILRIIRCIGMGWSVCHVHVILEIIL
mmetsp:Transcript_8546/g.17829  ORF Transcript_8546/g.17829 Transcript_8546/m.17829 type:complete len:242 (-) Transcript_8546:493-1218(-)